MTIDYMLQLPEDCTLRVELDACVFRTDPEDYQFNLEGIAIKEEGRYIPLYLPGHFDEIETEFRDSSVVYDMVQEHLRDRAESRAEGSER